MNKIRLQDLTPDVYYNTSRDFQFIGRLFDVILNSVKVNAEMLYNNPFSDNSDERLIDLMSLTLGFKSKHHYNVKQLTSLCSAFCEILKNKGNITSIKLAIRALLNAEGISDSFDCIINDDHTSITLYLPQNLTDLNLLKDLLVYILPAGMSCNIVRELRIESVASTNITTNDTIKRYIDVDTDTTSIIIKDSSDAITEQLAKNTAGLLANTDIYKPKENE